MISKEAAFYGENGRITMIMSGDEDSIKETAKRNNQSYAYIDENKNQGIRKLFVNSRGEVDIKKEIITLVYPEEVSLGQSFKIIGIPIGTTVYWPDGFEEVVNDNEIETEAEIQTDLVFVFDNPAFMEKTVTIHVTS